MIKKFRSLLGLFVLALLASAILAACGDATATTIPAATTAATTAVKATTAAVAATTAPGATTAAVAATTAPSATTAAVVATTAVAAQTTNAAATGTGKRGGVVKVALSQEPGTLNALFSDSDAADLVSGIVTEGLVRSNPQGQFEPVLAEEVPTPQNGGVSADGRTITYKLKKGVKWSDGEPFTAKDAVYTFRVIMEDSNGLAQSGYSSMKTVTAKDDNT